MALSRQEVLFIMKARDQMTRVLERQGMGFRDVAQKTGKATREVQRFGAASNRLRTVVAGLSGALAGIGAGLVLNDAIRTIAGFEDGMKRVQAVTGATGATFDALRARAKELGGTTQFSAQQAANGMEFLARAGFDTNQVLSAIKPSLDLAVAGSLDLATAADIASNVLSGFGLAAEETGRVADVLAEGSAAANTNVEQLGQAMKFVAPVAAAFGLSVEETAAGIGKLSDAGIQGSLAGTNLRGVIATLTQPTNQAKDVIAELGLSLGDVDVGARGLTPVLETLKNSNISATQAQRLFGRELGAGALVLIDNAEALGELTERLEGAGGAAERQAGVIGDTLTGAFKTLRSTVEDVFIELGDGGLLDAVKAQVQSLIDLLRSDAFRSFAQQVGQVVVAAFGFLTDVVRFTIENFEELKFAATALIAAFGIGKIAALVGVFGNVAVVVGKTLVGAFIAARAGALSFGAALATATGGLSLILQLIAGLAVALATADRDFKLFGVSVGEVTDFFVASWRTAVAIFERIFTSDLGDVLEFSGQLFVAYVKDVLAVLTAIPRNIIRIFSSIPEAVERALSGESIGDILYDVVIDEFDVFANGGRGSRVARLVFDPIAEEFANQSAIRSEEIAARFAKDIEEKVAANPPTPSFTAPALPDTPGGGGGGAPSSSSEGSGASVDREAAREAAREEERRLQAIRDYNIALSERIEQGRFDLELVGLATEEANRRRTIFDLENEARRQGIELTQQQAAAIQEISATELELAQTRQTERDNEDLDGRLQRLQLEIELMYEEETIRQGRLEMLELEQQYAERGLVLQDETRQKLEQIIALEQQRDAQTRTAEAGVNRFWKKYTDEATDASKSTEKILGTIATSGEKFFTDLILTGEASFKDFAAELLKQIAKIIIQQLIALAIATAVAALTGGASAAGGAGIGAAGGGGGLGAIFGGGGGGGGIGSILGLLGGGGGGGGGLLGFANGGVLRGGGFLPMRAFAGGGVVTSPTLALAGEGRSNEAIVPLPDGKSIPVSLQGGGRGGPQNVVFNMDITINRGGGGEGTEQDDQDFAQQVSQMIKVQVQETVSEALRPGGNLNPDGFGPSFQNSTPR